MREEEEEQLNRGKEGREGMPNLHATQPGSQWEQWSWEMPKWGIGREQTVAQRLEVVLLALGVLQRYL